MGLDIGSNTFSCAEIEKQGENIVSLDDVSLPVRLSEGLSSGGRLKPEAVTRGLDALAELVERFDLRRKPLRTAATAVLRKTAFPEDFTVPAEELLQSKIEIISGEQEAALTFKGAVCGIPESDAWVVMDVGGQSTEVGRRDASGALRGMSLDFGVVSLTERFVRTDPARPDELAAMGEEIRRIFKQSLPKGLSGNLLGVAGTATTLGMLSVGTTEWSRDKVHGLKMSLDEVVYWKNRMAACTSAQRTEKFGVRPLRADVFLAGICIVEEMIRFLGGDEFTVSANGLRIGVALSKIDLLNA